MVLENTLESPLDYKEIQPVYPEGDQSWIFIGRTNADAETQIRWPPDAKDWLTGKRPFVVQKLLILIRSHLFIFGFISRILGGGS